MDERGAHERAFSWFEDHGIPMSLMTALGLESGARLVRETEQLLWMVAYMRERYGDR